jgi:DNA-binding MarR family transcriptional regulator
MAPQDFGDAEPKRSDFDRAGDAMRDFYQRSHRLIDRIMTAKGASYARARTLNQIAHAGTLRSIDLATMSGFAPRTVTEAIDGLERDGLVVRTLDPTDRRVKRISLTAAGVAAVEAAEQSRVKYVQDVFGVLTADECEEIVRIVGILNERLADLGG